MRNRVQWYWTYNLPKFAAAKWLTNGWAVDGMFNFATGQPYTVSYLYEGDYNGSGEFYGRPDIIGNPQAAHSINPGNHGYNLLNASAFAAPCTWVGDAATGGCDQPQCIPAARAATPSTQPILQTLTSRSPSSSHLSERVTMQLRADLFNIFNHVNFSNPLLPGFSIDAFGGGGHVVGTGTQARLLAGSAPNQFVQTLATPDVGSGNPYLGGGGPRTMQLAARFAF